MMEKSLLKFTLLFFLSWIFLFSVSAQSRFPENKIYQDLLNQAKEEDKPMFLVIHNNGDQFLPFKTPISQTSIDLIHKKFITGEVELKRDDINHPLNKTFSLSSPIYLFTDKDGYPILRHNFPIKDDRALMQLIDSAHTIAQGETLGKLIAQYRKGIRNRLLLTKLLTQYQGLDLYTDQQVLSDYFAQLTIQELNNFETVIFLLGSGPIYNSKNYLLTHTNDKMVDSLYATLPAPQRKKINNRIIQQTFREALNKKDISLAQNIGYFAYNTWESNYLRGESSRRFHPLEYTRLMRDSINYISMAKNYYDNSFYQIDPDSMARIDFVTSRHIKGSPLKTVLDSAEQAIFNQGADKRRQYYKDEQARNLNYGSEQILNFGKKNIQALFDAIRWQQKAIAQHPGNGRYHHTLAQLLYHVGFYAQAEFEQQQAIHHHKSNKELYRQMQAVLKQMQSRTL
ncbi:tetratricopeptide repeat protein [Sphingobacterium sp. SG20118]|uniref:tetratricopeptide repeat protein n=1 Tax=Sphingobacterium sp. SG20118 TaxID=3367156 RepID=UPI0037DFC701